MMVNVTAWYTVISVIKILIVVMVTTFYHRYHYHALMYSVICNYCF